MKKVTLISKTNCELCKIAENIILKIKSKLDFQFESKKIDETNNLFELYKFKFPVILIDNIEVMYGRISESKLKELILN